MGAFHYLDPSVFFNAASLAADNTNESLVCVQLLTGLREARVLVIWQAGLVRYVRFTSGTVAWRRLHHRSC